MMSRTETVRHDCILNPPDTARMQEENWWLYKVCWVSQENRRGVRGGSGPQERHCRLCLNTSSPNWPDGLGAVRNCHLCWQGIHLRDVTGVLQMLSSHHWLCCRVPWRGNFQTTCRKRCGKTGVDFCTTVSIWADDKPAQNAIGWKVDAKGCHEFNWATETTGVKSLV